MSPKLLPRQVLGETIEHGVVIIATGGAEYKPAEYLYGQSPKIVTQLELEKKLVDKDASIQGLEIGGHDTMRRLS